MITNEAFSVVIKANSWDEALKELGKEEIEYAACDEDAGKYIFYLRPTY